jgi:AmmeMemoRadiSam system protein A
MTMPYSDEHKRLLIGVAWESIHHGFAHDRHFDPRAGSYPPEFLEKRAVFVTLQKGGALRGCIGTLSANESLVLAVAFYAFQSAFRDPRFTPLAREEADETSIALSVLSPPEPIAFADEADLLRQIRPGVDGLILEDRGRSGTFLPSVWEDLPDKIGFLNHLKRKAGFPESHWSDTLKVRRYEAEKIS